MVIKWSDLSRKSIKSCVPQGSILGPISYDIYQQSAWYVSFKAVVHDVIYSAANISVSLKRIHDLSVCWKTVFNPDITSLFTK